MPERGPDTTATNPFQHFVPDEAKLPAIGRVRVAYFQLLEIVQAECPASRERAVAITELETSAMWAIKSIVLPRG